MPTSAPIVEWTSATSLLWVGLNVVIVLAITSLSIWWDLERVNRPFPILRIIREPAFFTLVLIQSLIAFVFLVVLSLAGRASLHTMIDAVWVSVAGLSLLKTLPAPKSEDGQRLWGMADWFFQKFYMQLRLTISSLSIQFKDHLKTRYAKSPATFLIHVK